MSDCGNCAYYDDGWCEELGKHVTSYGACGRFVGTSFDSHESIHDCVECCFYEDGYCGYWRKNVSPRGKCSFGHA